MTPLQTEHFTGEQVADIPFDTVTSIHTDHPSRQDHQV
jgi:hypothetical protein